MISFRFKMSNEFLTLSSENDAGKGITLYLSYMFDSLGKLISHVIRLSDNESRKLLFQL